MINNKEHKKNKHILTKRAQSPGLVQQCSSPYSKLNSFTLIPWEISHCKRSLSRGTAHFTWSAQSQAMLENPIYCHTNAHYITHNPALRYEAIIPTTVRPLWCASAEVGHQNPRGDDRQSWIRGSRKLVRLEQGMTWSINTHLIPVI